MRNCNFVKKNKYLSIVIFGFRRELPTELRHFFQWKPGEILQSEICMIQNWLFMPIL